MIANTNNGWRAEETMNNSKIKESGTDENLFGIF